MSRETKIGLVVASSFLCLVGVVVASKFNQAKTQAEVAALQAKEGEAAPVQGEPPTELPKIVDPGTPAPLPTPLMSNASVFAPPTSPSFPPLPEASLPNPNLAPAPAPFPPMALTPLPPTGPTFLPAPPEDTAAAERARKELEKTLDDVPQKPMPILTAAVQTPVEVPPAPPTAVPTPPAPPTGVPTPPPAPPITSPPMPPAELPAPPVAVPPTDLSTPPVPVPPTVKPITPPPTPVPSVGTLPPVDPTKFGPVVTPPSIPPMTPPMPPTFVEPPTPKPMPPEIKDPFPAAPPTTGTPPPPFSQVPPLHVGTLGTSPAPIVSTPAPASNNSKGEMISWDGSRDSFLKLSEKYYGTSVYAGALQALDKLHNNNRYVPMTGDRVLIPDKQYLDANFAEHLKPVNPSVSAPLSPPPPFGAQPTPAPISTPPFSAPISTPPFTAPPVSIKPTIPLAGNGKQYQVPAAGKFITEIAKEELGSEFEWNRIYELNPNLTIGGAQRIPGGTILTMPARR